MGTSVARSTKSTTFCSGAGTAYGIKGEQVDGMDVLAVKAAGEKAVAALPGRSRGPTFWK